MISPLFSKIPHEFIEEFKLDFLPLVRMTKELDKEFGEAEEEIVYNLPKYKMYDALFNKKYRWVYVKFIETNEGFQLRLYIKGEKNVKDAFLNAASKIEGVLAIGAESLERDSVFDQNELELELMQIRDRYTYFIQEMPLSCFGSTKWKNWLSFAMIKKQFSMKEALNSSFLLTTP